MVSYEKRNGLFTTKVKEKNRFFSAFEHFFLSMNEKRLLEMPSFQMANRWYDQSYSEVLNYKDIDVSFNVLRKYELLTNSISETFWNDSDRLVSLKHWSEFDDVTTMLFKH